MTPMREALIRGAFAVVVTALALIVGAWWYGQRRRVWKRDASWAAVRRRSTR